MTIQKRFGYIYDYEGLLGDLNDAMNTYKALQGFDENDLKGVVKPIKEVIDELPAAHRRLLDLFKPVKNKLDHEQMEQHLRDDELRKEFSDRLAEFARLLEQALGSEKAYDYIKAEEMEKFRGDWVRLKNLRRSAALRYQDSIDMREYEPRILQLLNDNVAADPAKIVGAPVFHVNGDNPEAVVFCAELAFDYRRTFGRDVVIDLVCYRRHGHNEADEPAATQPLMYQNIRSRKTTRELYAEQLIGAGVLVEADAKALVDGFRAKLDKGEVTTDVAEGRKDEFAVDWTPWLNGKLAQTVKTGLAQFSLESLAKKISAVPESQ